MKINLSVKTALKSSSELLEIQKRVLFSCMLKMQSLARHYVLVDTGILKNSIQVYPMSFGSENYTLSDGVDYGIYVEYGTSPHIIKPVTKEALSFEWTEYKGKMLSKSGRLKAGITKAKSGKAVFKQVMHPGTNPNPFMRPALDQVKEYWLTVFWNKELDKT